MSVASNPLGEVVLGRDADSHRALAATESVVSVGVAMTHDATSHTARRVAAPQRAATSSKGICENLWFAGLGARNRIQKSAEEGKKERKRSA